MKDLYKGLFIVSVLLLISGFLTVSNYVPYDNLNTYDNSNIVIETNPVKEMMLSANGYESVGNYEFTSSLASEDLILGDTYDVNRSFYVVQYGGAQSNDADDQGISHAWVNGSAIHFSRTDAGVPVIISIWVVQFSEASGLKSTQLANIDSPQYVPIGRTVVMANTFLIQGDTSANYGYDRFKFHAIAHLYNTTHVEVKNMGLGDVWSDFTVQVIEWDELTVQRGVSSERGGTELDIAISSVTITQSTLNIQMYNPTFDSNIGVGTGTGAAFFVNSTAIRLRHGYNYPTVDNPLGNPGNDYYWEVVEWPSDTVSIQWVLEEDLEAEYYEDTTVTAVDVDNTLIMYGGSALNTFGTGVYYTANYNYDDALIRANSTSFINSTTIRTYRVDDARVGAEYYLCLMEFAAPNSVPENDATPVCTNLDDTDNLYARYKLYEFSVSTTDADGASDIDYVELSCMQSTTVIWTVRFDEDTATFSEQINASYIELTGSTNVTSGVNLDITFKLYIEWVHPDASNYDLRQKTIDTAAESDTDDYTAIDYDYETRLAYSVAPSLSDGIGNVTRGNYNTEDGIAAAGTLIYYGSGDNYPPSDEVDVYVSCGDCAGSPWSDTTLSSGAFSMTVDSDDVVGTDTYTFKPVIEGAGSGGTTLYYTSDLTKKYVADAYTVSFTVTDNRIDINTNASVTYTVISDYDSKAYGGTVNLNYSTWEQASAGRWNFTVSSLDGDDPDGVTAISTNDEDYVIWDSYTVIFTVDDNRININTNATVGYTVISDYDSIAYDGTVNLNYSTWEQASAQRQGFTVSSLGGDDTYGITAISSNDEEYIIWDSYTISFTVDDNRININENATVSYTVISDYDSITYDGTVNLNYSTWTQASAQRQGFTVSSLGGDDTYGITVIKTNDEDYVIWDSYTVSITVDDNRIDIGTNATVGYTIISDYDSIAYDGTVNLNYSTWTQTTVQRQGFTVASLDGNDTYGITAIGTNDDDYVIWDQILITLLSADDYRLDINTNVTLYASAIYDYDDAAVEDGTITLNSTTIMTWNGTYFVNETGYSTAIRYCFNVTSISGNTYGITHLNWSTGYSPYYLYDYLGTAGADTAFEVQNFTITLWYMAESYTYGVDDASGEGWVAWRNYGGAGPGGFLIPYRNWGDSDGLARWYGVYNNTDGAGVGYTFTQPTDHVAWKWYFTCFTVNSSGYYWVWRDTTLLASGSVGAAFYNWQYDTTNLAPGAWGDYWPVHIDDMRFYNYTFSAAEAYKAYYGIYPSDDNLVGQWDFDGDYTDSTGNGHDLTNYGSGSGIAPGSPLYVVWDSVTISITGPIDNRQNLNVNATGIVVSAVYDYDGESYSGTLNLNNTDYDGDGTVVRWDYTVDTADGDDTFGITAISTNDDTYMIWDEIEVYFGAVTDTRTNINEQEFPYFRLRLKYDNHILNITGSDTVTINGSTGYWSVGYDGWYKYYTQTSVGNWTFIITAASENTYGITSLNLASVTVYMKWIVWDALTAYVTVPDDQRINIGDNCTGLVISAIYEYDSTAFDGALTLNDTTYDHGTVGIYYYNVTVASGDSYGITVISNNGNNTYCIFDALTAYVATPDDQRININANCTGLIIWAIYEYDSTLYDGGLELNDTTYLYNTVDRRDYNVTVADGLDTYGITVISGNGNQTYCIWDALTAYVSVPDDQRIDINTNCTGLEIWAIYEYDSTPYDGGLTLNDTTYDYGVVDIYYYNVTIADGLDSYGITVITNNGNQTYCIFDEFEVYESGTTDNRTNVGETEHPWFRLRSKYDSHYMNSVSDSIAINGSVGTWVADVYDYWYKDYTYDTVLNYTFCVTAFLEDTYGITALDSSSVEAYTVWIVWDALTAYVSVPDDQRINVGDNCTGLILSAIYEYDSTSYDGTLHLNDTTYDYGVVGIYYYNVTVADGDDSYGITVISNNGNQTYCIFDALTAYISVPDDQRININDNCTGLTLWAIYEYDSTAYDGGLELNDTTYDHGVVGIYYYNITTADGLDTYGITVISSNGNQTYCIFDSLTAYVSVPNDQRIDINTNCTGLELWAIYNYDSTAYDGSLELNDTTYDYGSVGIYYYNVTTADGLDAYGITVISNLGNQTYCIFDSLTCYVSPPTDQRGDVNDNATGMILWAIYNYDSSVYDGGLTLNNTDYNGDGTVTRWDYNVTIADGLDTYGITVIAASNTTYMIWDRALWQSIVNVNATQDYGINGYRVDTGTYVNITILVYYEYDNTAITDGTILLNGEGLTHIANGYWYLIAQNTTAAYGQDYTFDTIATDGNAYDIEVENQNGNSLMIIWDEIFIYEDGCDYTDTFARVNVGQNVTLWANAKLRYDNTTLGAGDYLEFGDEQMFWNATSSRFEHSYVEFTVGLFTYTINTTLCYEDTYGITVGKNSPVSIIFDRILIYDMWTNATAYTNLGDDIEVWASLVSEYDNESMQVGLVQLNGTLGTEAAGNINMTFSTLSNWYNVTTIPSSGNWTFQITWANWTTYNLTNINYNGWNVTYLYGISDRIIIYAWTDNSTDNRDDINTQLNISLWLQYESDSANVTDGSIWITGEALAYLSGGNWTALFSNATASDATWNTLVASGNARGITAVNLNGFSIFYIWDSYTVNITIGDNRINIGDNATIGFTVLSDYDSIAYDGTTVLNDTTYDYDNVSIRYYTLSALTGDDTYGITIISTNDVDYVIFDALCYEVEVLDNRIDIYDTARIWANITRAYDGVNFIGTDGSVLLNGSSMTYSSGNGWYRDVMYASMVGYYFEVDSVTDDIYGITELLDGFVFNGNVTVNVGYLEYSVTDAFDIDSFSLSFWFYPESGHIPSDADYMGLAFAFGTPAWSALSNTKWYVYIYNNAGNIEIYFDCAGKTGDGWFGGKIDDFDDFCSWDSWNHLTITVSTGVGNSIGNAWINGNHVKDDWDMGGYWDYNDGNMTYFYFGVAETGGVDLDGLFYGYMKNIKFYNTTLSDAECAALYGDTYVNELYLAFGEQQAYQFQIWDSLTITIMGPTDNRQNLNANASGIVVSAIYDYDSSVFDGTLTLNNTDYNGDGTTTIWYYTVDHANGDDSYNITVITINDVTYMIWDSLTITINIIDQRINIGDNATLYVSAVYDYDNTSYDGDFLLNDTTYDHSVIGIYYYTVVIAENDTYNITLIGTNDIDYVIFDAYDYTIAVNDTRTGVNQYVTISLTLQYLYDSTTINDGSIYVNGTLGTYNGTYWNSLITNGTVGLYYYTVSSIINNTYNITQFYDNGGTYSIGVIFDQLTFVLATNMTWTISTYYINISYTATYDYDSTPAGITSISIANHTGSFTNYVELTNASVCNNTYYVTSIESENIYNITSLATNIVWCVFDNITPSSVNYYNDVTVYYKIFKITFDQLVWSYNGSPIGADWICKNIRNGTIVSTATTGATSYLDPYLQQVAIPVDWIYLLYTNNATKTVNGRAYNFQWYEVESTAVADLLIRNLIQRQLDTEISVSGSFNTNMTYLIYNEGMLSGEAGILNITTEGQEEGFQLKFDILLVVGRHNFSIYFAAIYGSGDLWFNQSYYVNFELYIEIPEQKGFNMEVKGTSNVDCEWYVYNKDDADWTSESGTIAGGRDYFQFLFLLETSVGMHNYSLYFNVSSTYYVWKNGTYYVTGAYDLCTVTLYDGQSNVFIDNNYKLYINGTRSPSYTFFNRTDYVYNLTFTDYFGYTVHSAIYDYDRFIDIELDVYTFKIYSEMSSEFVYFNLTRTGGATFSQHLGPGEILSYRLVAGTYTYDFKKINGAGFSYYTGTFTLTGDTSYIISDISLEEIWLTILRNMEGTNNDLPVLMAGMSSMAQSLAFIQWALLAMSAIIIGLMVFRGYTTEEVVIGADGKPKKKRKLPKVLKKHQFGKGASNPKFSGIPKGAGQDAWGTTWKKDEQ